MNTSGSPHVCNIAIPVSGVETEIVISKGCKKLLLQVREGGNLKIAFKKGESGTNYFTLRTFSTYYEEFIHGPFSFYVQSDLDNTTIELVTWYNYN